MKWLEETRLHVEFEMNLSLIILYDNKHRVALALNFYEAVLCMLNLGS